MTVSILIGQIGSDVHVLHCTRWFLEVHRQVVAAEAPSWAEAEEVQDRSGEVEEVTRMSQREQMGCLVGCLEKPSIVGTSGHS